MKPEVHKWLEDGNLDWVEKEYFSQPKNIAWAAYVAEVYQDVVEYGGYNVCDIGDFHDA